MISTSCAEVQSARATIAEAACRWEGERMEKHSDNGLLEALAGTNLDAYLMEYCCAKDLAVLGATNTRLRCMCNLFCVERLRYFFGLDETDKDENVDLESLPIVAHFLKQPNGSLAYFLHVVTCCREQTIHTRLSLGESHTAVVVPGKLGESSTFVFGEGKFGQLGLGDNFNYVAPTRLNSGFLGNDPSGNLPNDIIVAVACGKRHTALLSEQGRIFTFGHNENMQLGVSSCNSRNYPELVPIRWDERGEVVYYTKVVAGKAYTAATTNSGRVAVFGNGLVCDLEEGYLLQDGDIDRVNGEHIVQLAAGQDHLLMLSNRNKIYAVGNGSYGKLGIAANLVLTQRELLLPANERAPFERMRQDRSSSVPRLVATAGFENERIVQIAAGGNHSAAVTAHGGLYTWGGCGYGELGIGRNLRCVPQATKVNLGESSPFALQVSCGYSHTAVLTSCGRILTFGDGRHKQHGLKQLFFATSHPQSICLGELENHRECLSSVICGGRHTAIMDAKGDLFTFGDPSCAGRPFRSSVAAQYTKHLPKFVPIGVRLYSGRRVY